MPGLPPSLYSSLPVLPPPPLGGAWGCLDIPSSGGQRLESRGLASSLAAPPEQGIAFYINDFNLSSPLPWHLPEQIGRPGPEPALRSLEAIWQEPNRSAFHAVFLDAMEAIRQRRVLKVVPAATAAAYVIADPGPTLHGLVHPHRSSGRGQAAAWSDGRQGFATITPEVLFE